MKTEKQEKPKVWKVINRGIMASTTKETHYFLQKKVGSSYQGIPIGTPIKLVALIEPEPEPKRELVRPEEEKEKEK